MAEESGILWRATQAQLTAVVHTVHGFPLLEMDCVEVKAMVKQSNLPGWIDLIKY